MTALTKELLGPRTPPGPPRGGDPPFLLYLLLGLVVYGGMVGNALGWWRT